MRSNGCYFFLELRGHAAWSATRFQSWKEVSYQACSARHLHANAVQFTSSGAGRLLFVLDKTSFLFSLFFIKLFRRKPFSLNKWEVTAVVIAVKRGNYGTTTCRCLACTKRDQHHSKSTRHGRQALSVGTWVGSKRSYASSCSPRVFSLPACRNAPCPEAVSRQTQHSTAEPRPLRRFLLPPLRLSQRSVLLPSWRSPSRLFRQSSTPAHTKPLVHPQNHKRFLTQFLQTMKQRSASKSNDIWTKMSKQQEGDLDYSGQHLVFPMSRSSSIW